MTGTEGSKSVGTKGIINTQQCFDEHAEIKCFLSIVCFFSLFFHTDLKLESQRTGGILYKNETFSQK